MPGIPYTLSTLFAKKLNWPKMFYWQTLQTLTYGNVLQLAAHQARFLYKSVPVEDDMLYFVIRHLIYRTLQFEKPCEFVRHKEVIEGNVSSAIAPCNLSPASVNRAINGLAGLPDPPEEIPRSLVKLHFVVKGRKIITPMLGLNIPAILEGAAERWTEKLLQGENDIFQERVRSPSNLMLRTRAVLEILVTFASPWSDAFDFLCEHNNKPIADVESFLKEWGKRFPDPKKERNAYAVDEELKLAIKEDSNLYKLRKKYFGEPVEED